MKFYVSQTIGTGTEEDPFRPAIDNYVNDWRAVDMRKDVTVSGVLFVECNPDAAAHAAIVADPLILFLDTGDIGLDDPLSNNINLATLLSDLELCQVPCDDFTGANTLRQLLQRITKRFLIRQTLGSSDVPNDLESTLTPAQQLGVAAVANSFGVNIALDKTTRELIKDVTAIPNKFLATHYDN